MLLSLDLSTSTGWAFFDGLKLSSHGVIVHKAEGRPPKVRQPKGVKLPRYCVNESHLYPYNMIDAAQAIASDVSSIMESKVISQIVVEESNQSSKDRFATKQSEFIHYAIACLAREKGIPLKYLDTSKWKKILSISLTKDQRAHNKLVKEKKAKGKITGKHITVAWVNEKYNLTLLQKDNDIADAIALGTAFLNQ